MYINHFFLWAPLLTCVLANVEKVVFLGPQQAPVPESSLGSLDQQLRVLTPENFSIRTELERVFPDSQDHGLSHWFLLRNLTNGQRYEVRVCWAATEPTRFDMEVYSLLTVRNTPNLIDSLSAYVASHHPNFKTAAEEISDQEHMSSDGSDLLLHVEATADYYSDIKDLMSSPPPVLVDLILDPFIFNVLPRSLLPTGLYIVLVAIASWFVAGLVRSQLQLFANNREEEEKKNT